MPSDSTPDTITPRFRVGQRWISVAEPELGLGEVRHVGPRTVTLAFPATRDTRQYVASDDAPIRRAAFRVGDRIATHRDGHLIVTAVVERDGLLSYACGERAIPEQDLSSALSFSSPVERLFAGHVDASAAFDLRVRALTHQFERRRSEVRGFVGGRIDLLPHQLGIAAEVTSRLLPRVLLADEVGLGKTIEACLILHRLVLAGRAQRILIVVPETLVHQWFLELLRRFHLWFHIFTEARCTAIEEASPGANPFLDDQLVLCELRLLIDNPERLGQALAAGWDVVVADEAHHLRWSPGTPSAEYVAVERLGRASQGLLLLTATPEQLGVDSHFARLRLLDPDRFHDLDQFVRDSTAYGTVARLARLLHEGRPLDAGDRRDLARMLGETADAVADVLDSLDTARRVDWIDRLLDQHGTGRVMFRNTRATIAGFPARRAHLHPLPAGTPARAKALASEWQADVAASDAGTDEHEGWPGSLAHDARVEWLLTLLQSLAPQKVLVICRTPRKAIALESALRQRTAVPLAAFHEGLTLIQRDRAAAWFADPEGARVLICSEIGSEGRNFQFAHHLVLFDLPLDPALVEQRIGRLDRIGQQAEVHIHVPFVVGSHLEVLARWYHDGLNAFEAHLPGARELLDQFEAPLRALTARASVDQRDVAADLAAFVAEVREARLDVARRLDEGRNRLLEWNSFRPGASRIVDVIRAQDSDRALDDFLLDVLDHYLIEVEEVAPRTWRLGSAGVLVDDFPGLRAEGLTYTRDRGRALLREDLQFVTWDHPLATGALDRLLGSERGNCGFALWREGSGSALYLEAVYLLECLAPAALHADRFLPPTPVRLAVDHRGRDATTAVASASFDRQAALSTAASLLTRAEIRDGLLPKLVDRSRLLAEARTPAIVAVGRERMRGQLDHEITRLRALQQVNRSVSDREIALLVAERDALDAALDGARLRLDAVRLIYRAR